MTSERRSPARPAPGSALPLRHFVFDDGSPDRSPKVGSIRSPCQSRLCPGIKADEAWLESATKLVLECG